MDASVEESSIRAGCLLISAGKKEVENAGSPGRRAVRPESRESPGKNTERLKTERKTGESADGQENPERLVSPGKRDGHPSGTYSALLSPEKGTKRPENRRG